MIIYGQYEWVFNYVEFALDMQAVRAQRGLTKNEVAKRAGISGSWAGDLEAGKFEDRITLKDVIKVCNVLELDPRKYLEIERSTK